MEFVKKHKVLCVILAVVVVIIAYQLFFAKPEDPDSELSAVPEPANGAILSGYEDFDGSEITITAPYNSACVVKLKTSSGVERLSFYVKPGATVTVGVPAEYLYVYFATGKTWYGNEHLFGNDTSYSKDDDLLDFARNTWSYTLHPVTDGNFSQTPIDENEFK